MEFEALYAQFAPMVSTLAFRLLGDRTECEDAVQETFLQVYRGLPHFRGESSLKTWVYRIAVNTCLQQVRRRAARHEQLDTATVEQLLASAGPAASIAPDEAPLLREALQEIAEGCFTALTAQLPENQRVVYVFADMLEWPVPAVAELLGLSAEAVKSRLHRARANMGRFFGPKCSLLDPDNPCTCESRLPAAERFDPDLIRRARARIEAGRPRARERSGPLSLLEMVRSLPAYEADPAARERFFARIHAETESGGPTSASK